MPLSLEENNQIKHFRANEMAIFHQNDVWSIIISLSRLLLSIMILLWASQNPLLERKWLWLAKK